jgi:hypothetical protein
MRQHLPVSRLPLLTAVALCGVLAACANSVLPAPDEQAPDRNVIFVQGPRHSTSGDSIPPLGPEGDSGTGVRGMVAPAAAEPADDPLTTSQRGVFGLGSGG